MSRLTEPQDVVRVLDYPFAPLPIWMLADQNGDVGDGAKILWGYLRWRQGPHPDCWPSVIRMAADLGVSRVVILRRLAELEKAGYIETRRQPGRVNRYTVFCRPTRECQLSESMAQELHVPGAVVNTEDNSRPVSKTIPVSQTEQTSIENDTTPVSKTILHQYLKRDTNYMKEQEKITERNNEDSPAIEIRAETEDEQSGVLTDDPPLLPSSPETRKARDRLLASWVKYLEEVFADYPQVWGNVKRFQLVAREGDTWIVKHDPMLIDSLHSRLPAIYDRMLERVRFVA